MYYLVKLRFEIENEKTGKVKKVREQYLIKAKDPAEADNKANEKFGEGMGEMHIEAITESKIMAVIED